uniref:Cyclic nucleotide-binding domain-containing protein n=1 Tax=Octactis speculum TaxID=3111310 RepID=A0A7S2GP25_9STRA
MVTIGFIKGLFLGTMASCFTFIVYYGMFTPPVRNIVPVGQLQANIYRPLAQRAALKKNGNCIVVLQLQGFLMFSCMPNVLAAMNELLSQSQQNGNSELPHFLVVHLRHVTAVDYSAAYGFLAMRRAVKALENWSLVFCDLPANVEVVLFRTNCLTPADQFFVHSSLNAAMEDCEKRLLEFVNVTAPRNSIGDSLDTDGQRALAIALTGILEPLLPPAEYEAGNSFADAVTELAQHWQVRRCEANEAVWSAGNAANFIAIVSQGRFYTTKETQKLKSVVEHAEVGAVLGYLAFCTHRDRNCTLVALTDGELLTMSWAVFEQLRATRPYLVHALMLAFITRSATEYEFHCNLTGLAM